MIVYVVFGRTGEYSDREEWLVKAFTSENSAKELVLKATEAAAKVRTSRESEYRVQKGVNLFDPEMAMDYTGTFYYYEPVELEQ